MTPSTFKPQSVEDFLGDAGKIARLLSNKIAKVKEEPNARLKLLLLGTPGSGKSELAMFLARQLVTHSISIQKLNGQSFSVDWVRECYSNRMYRPFDNGWSVQIVNEIDAASPEALAQALEYWDDLPPHFCFIATSNSELAKSDMTKEELKKAIPLRVHSRFIPYKFGPVRPDEIAMFLFQRWQIPFADGLRLAQQNGGDVRATFNDSESFLDRQEAVAV